MNKNKVWKRAKMSDFFLRIDFFIFNKKHVTQILMHFTTHYHPKLMVNKEVRLSLRENMLFGHFGRRVATAEKLGFLQDALNLFVFSYLKSSY